LLSWLSQCHFTPLGSFWQADQVLDSDGLCLSTGTAALEEDAQILKVIEAYCTSAKTRQTLNSSKCHGNMLG
jgi:hypothetical protein